MLSLPSRAVWIISIHALLAESDPRVLRKPAPGRNISIHALLAESDRGGHISETGSKHFYPRSPCGERLHYDNYNLHCTEISIHALLAESDKKYPAILGNAAVISIHALLAESDAPWPAWLASCAYFYPRSPCGERQDTLTDDVSTGGFLSTLSLRRATPWALQS